ncbi:MAG: hypothetical protein ACLFS5_09985 [Spirochaetaceae bacterium]
MVLTVAVFSTTVLESCDLLLGEPSGQGRSAQSDTVPNPLPAGHWPIIPQPAAPYEDTPARSGTLTVTKPLAGDYRPTVLRANGNWEGELTFATYEYNAWLDQLTTFFSSSEPVGTALTESFSDEILLSYDAPDLPGSCGQSYWTPPSVPVVHTIDVAMNGYTEALTAAPYLRRDRYWQRLPIGEDKSSFKVLIGDTDYSLTTSNIVGTSTASTESFGRSVTASAGLSFGGLSAAVETTLSESFSTTTEIHAEQGTQETYHVSGEDGTYVQFQVWAGVEVYTITDADGEPFTDPSYELELDELMIHGFGPSSKPWLPLRSTIPEEKSRSAPAVLFLCADCGILLNSPVASIGERRYARGNPKESPVFVLHRYRCASPCGRPGHAGGGVHPDHGEQYLLASGLQSARGGGGGSGHRAAGP